MQLFKSKSIYRASQFLFSYQFLTNSKSGSNSIKNAIYQFHESHSQTRKFCSKAGIIGVPFNKGQPKRGVEMGPSVLRNAELVKKLSNLDVDVKDFGDVAINDATRDLPHGNVKNAISVGLTNEKVSNSVSKIHEEGRLCLVLGGDHSISIGTVHGHAQIYPNICVLWVDAHSDLNTASSTLSGNMHGMPCSFLIHEMQEYATPVSGFEWFLPCVPKQHFAYIGIRDLDSAEKVFLEKLGIAYYTMRNIEELGIVDVTRRALDKINPHGDLSLHVSFDIDAIDKYLVPSTGSPVPGGLTVRESICLAEEVSKSGMMKGLDMVEVNPLLGNKDDVEKTVDIAIHVIKAFFENDRIAERF